MMKMIYVLTTCMVALIIDVPLLRSMDTAPHEDQVDKTERKRVRFSENHIVRKAQEEDHTQEEDDDANYRIAVTRLNQCIQLLSSRIGLSRTSQSTRTHMGFLIIFIQNYYRQEADIMGKIDTLNDLLFCDPELCRTTTLEKLLVAFQDLQTTMLKLQASHDKMLGFVYATTATLSTSLLCAGAFYYLSYVT